MLKPVYDPFFTMRPSVSGFARFHDCLVQLFEWKSSGGVLYNRDIIFR